MTSHRHELRTFLQTHGHDAAVIERGLGVAEPLLQNVERSCYDLGRPDVVDIESTASAFRQILNGAGPVRSIAFVSARTPSRESLALPALTELEEIINRRFGAAFRTDFEANCREDEWRATYWD